MITKEISAYKKHPSNTKTIDLLSAVYAICQLTCSILVIYFCWYVEAYGNFALLVNGIFLVMSACIVLIWLIEGTIHLDGIPNGIWHQFFMAAYFLIVGIFIAYDFSSLLHSVRQYFIYGIIMYAICLVSKRKKSYDWFLQMVNISILICCIHLLGWGYHYTTNRIVLSSNSNPNVLGTILNLGLFVVMLRCKVTLKSLAIYIPQICLILYNVVMTGSRKSLIVSVILLCMWGLFAFLQTIKNGSLSQKLIILLVIFCAIIAAWYYYNTFVIHTAVYDRMQTMTNEESNNVRIEMYNEAVQIFLKKPFFGGGFDQYKFLSGRGGYSHSTYAEALADFGVVGMFLYFFQYIYTVFVARKLAFVEASSFRSKFIFGFCLVELFLGTVQIWFIEISHFFAWTMIFLVIQDLDKFTVRNMNINERYSKYVRG